jgi:hypothetical protein
VAGVAAACAARSDDRVRVIRVAGALNIYWEQVDARVRAFRVAGALKNYWEQVPKLYTKFGSILIAEPLERFLQEQILQKSKLGIFFFFRGGSAWAAFEKGGGDKW